MWNCGIFDGLTLVSLMRPMTHVPTTSLRVALGLKFVLGPRIVLMLGTVLSLIYRSFSMFFWRLVFSGNLLCCSQMFSVQIRRKNGCQKKRGKVKAGIVAQLLLCEALHICNLKVRCEPGTNGWKEWFTGIPCKSTKSRLRTVFWCYLRFIFSPRNVISPRIVLMPRTVLTCQVKMVLSLFLL